MKYLKEYKEINFDDWEDEELDPNTTIWKLVHFHPPQNEDYPYDMSDKEGLLWEDDSMVYIAEKFINEDTVLLYEDNEWVDKRLWEICRKLTKDQKEKYIFNDDVPIKVAYNTGDGFKKDYKDVYYSDLPDDIKKLIS